MSKKEGYSFWNKNAMGYESKDLLSLIDEEDNKDNKIKELVSRIEKLEKKVKELENVDISPELKIAKNKLGQHYTHYVYKE